MISKEEVKHISKLARLELTEKEVEKMQKDISAILDYFNLLKKADTSKVKIQAAFAQNGTNGMRTDEIEVIKNNLKSKIINAFPDRKDDYIKVKTIL